MKKIFVGALLLIALVIAALGVFRGYQDYSYNAYIKNRGKVISMIQSNAKNVFKTNDLIFTCELLRELKYDEKDSTLQLISENHSIKYKKFSNLIRKNISSDSNFNKFNDQTNELLQEALCTYTIANRYNLSVYASLLSKKYNQSEHQGSITNLENANLSVADVMELAEAKYTASKIREAY